MGAYLPDEEDLELRIRENSTANKTFKSYINASTYINSAKGLKVLEETALKFLEKHGPARKAK